MMDALRRFLIRREIRRWKAMRADYLRQLRNEKLFRKTDWISYETKVSNPSRALAEDSSV